MQITIEYMLQFLGELLRQGGTAEEKVRLVEAFYNAALKHVNDVQNELFVGKETEQEKRTKKEIEKEIPSTEQANCPLNACDPVNKSSAMQKLKRMTPQDIRRLVDPAFLDFMDQTELMPKFAGLMSNMTVPLSAAQYVSWLTRYPKGLIDMKLLSLEQHPTHYGRTNVPSTIMDWIKQDGVKMTSIQRTQWNDAFRQQQPMILEMINQHLKPKRNGKQTTIDFDAADASAASATGAASEPADGDPAAVHTADDGRQPGLPDA